MRQSSILLATAAACASVLAFSATAAVASVVINEVVTDPQRDWDDSGGGNGSPFDGMPGIDPPTQSDEWIEIYNAGTSTIDLNGWTLEMNDTIPAVVNLSPPSGATFVYTPPCSGSSFAPGCYLVVGNPMGSMSNDVYLVLRDGGSSLVDDVELGDDPEGDGVGDGAPDGSPDGGNASGPSDEAVVRFPNGVDTDDDVADFDRQTATIGAANPTLPSVPAAGSFARLAVAAAIMALGGFLVARRSLSR